MGRSNEYTSKDKHVANGNCFLTFVDVHSVYLTFIILHVMFTFIT